MFRLCRRAESDPTYARYPRLPVRVCAGFEAHLAGMVDVTLVDDASKG